MWMCHTSLSPILRQASTHHWIRKNPFSKLLTTANQSETGILFENSAPCTSGTGIQPDIPKQPTMMAHYQLLSGHSIYPSRQLLHGGPPADWPHSTRAPRELPGCSCHLPKAPRRVLCFSSSEAHGPSPPTTMPPAPRTYCPPRPSARQQRRWSFLESASSFF
jgi:hypothetical protein